MNTLFLRPYAYLDGRRYWFKLYRAFESNEGCFVVVYQLKRKEVIVFLNYLII